MADIVITGVVTDNTDLWQDLMGATHFYTPRQMDDGSGGGAGGSDGFYDALQSFFKYILEKLFDKAVETEAERQHREETVSTKFDPSEVVATSSYTTSDGRQGRTWNMSDNTEYWDTDGNGKPDYQTKFDSGGHLYGFDGSGWKQLN